MRRWLIMLAASTDSLNSVRLSIRIAGPIASRPATQLVARQRRSRESTCHGVPTNLSAGASGCIIACRSELDLTRTLLPASR